MSKILSIAIISSFLASNVAPLPLASLNTPPQSPAVESSPLQTTPLFASLPGEPYHTDKNPALNQDDSTASPSSKEKRSALEGMMIWNSTKLLDKSSSEPSNTPTDTPKTSGFGSLSDALKQAAQRDTSHAAVPESSSLGAAQLQSSQAVITPKLSQISSIPQQVVKSTRVSISDDSLDDVEVPQRTGRPKQREIGYDASPLVKQTIKA